MPEVLSLIAGEYYIYVKTIYPLVDCIPLRHHSDDSGKQWYDWFRMAVQNLLLIGRDQLPKTTLAATASTATSNLSSSRTMVSGDF